MGDHQTNKRLRERDGGTKFPWEFQKEIEDYGVWKEDIFSFRSPALTGNILRSQVEVRTRRKHRNG